MSKWKKLQHMEKQDERYIVREEDASSGYSAHKTENVTDENWKFEHLKVFAYIIQCVEDNVRKHIVNKTHARILWEKLETIYVSKNWQ